MKKILISLSIPAIILLGWYFWIHQDAAAEATADTPAAKVETMVLKEEPLTQTIEVFGVVASAPSGDRVIAAPYDCVVRQIHLGVGATVAAGDRLLDIGPSPDTQLAFDSARSVLALATQSLASTQERYELKLATRQDLLTAQQAVDDARLKVSSLEARGLGGNGRITATTAGVVSKLDIFAGALVPQGTALVTVSTGGQLEVQLGAEAADVASIAVGQPVTLESSQRPGAGKISTTVRMVGAALDPATGAVEVRAVVPAGAALLLGEHVRAEIEIKHKDRTLVVPRSAVLPDHDQSVLFTVKVGKAVKHVVRTGLATDKFVEVTGVGLHAGDVVVTLGNYELEDGMAIQPPEPKAAGPAPKAKP